MTFTRVVVPVDFSEQSLAAVAVGQDLAMRGAASLQLLTISASNMVADSEAALAALSKSTGQSTSWRVIPSDSDPEITLVLEILEAGDNSLWCLGSHGRTAFGELLFGSISADVVREVETRVVMVGPRACARPAAQVMLVAIDGTHLSAAILQSAVEVADTLKMSLRLVQVGQSGTPIDSDESSYIRNFVEQLDAPHNRDFDVLHGEPASAIAEYVKETPDVGMVAMATRGIPAGARLTMGSTALSVLRHAEVPVLMLHPAAVDRLTTDAESTPSSR
jgi:nucleotide-binding universal stress UspA family protein